MAEGVPQWEDLKCVCGNEMFTEQWKIRMHPLQGISRQKGPDMCPRCKRTVNPAQLKNILEKKQELANAKRVIKEAEEEESKAVGKKAG